MKRETLQNIIRWAIKHVTDTQFIGLENIPQSGGVILATNHLSYVDIALLFAFPSRPDITALVTDKYLQVPFIRWFTNTAGGIWIDRTKADFAAFRSAAEVLAARRALGIAPEGTRSTTGLLLEGKPGTTLLALKTGAPIVPVAIYGTETTFREFKRLRKPHLYAKFGRPMTLAPLERDNREEQLQNYTTEMMCQIAVLLPEVYRGFYRDHPRVKELLGAPEPAETVLHFR